MAKVKITGHASGSGVFTITAPNSNTDRTITLPDASVTLGTDATKLPLAGGAVTGNVTFGDNNKAIFGAGTDGQIYSDGTNLVIADGASGGISIHSDALYLRNSAGTEYTALFAQDGSVRLRYDNADKLETSAAGVTITGTPNSTVMPTLGGVAIAAKGSNSNGKYTKFADGTMICEVTKTTTEQNNGATAGGFYTSDNYTWTYPVAFHSVPRVVANQRGGHNNAIAAKTTSESTSAATFLTLSVNSTGNSQEISLLAYGWWTA